MSLDKGKIRWLIAALFLIILLIASYYFCFSRNKKLLEKTQTQEEKEFSEFLIEKKKLLEEDEEVFLIAVGDISFSRGVEQAVENNGDLFYPFLKTMDYFKSADLVFGNLETPITAGKMMPNFAMIFRSNPGVEQVLKEVGFSVLSLANNHTLDFKEKGLKDTLEYLDNAGIQYVGAGKNAQEANNPAYIEKNGIKFSFLAYNDNDVVPATHEASEDRMGTAFMRIDKMTSSVKEAKEKSDFVIISMHSGTEYADRPNDSQIKFARAAIDAGADLVIGHHPHVIQPIEKYKGKYIFYSLGNFIFDQMWSLETKQGLIVKIYFTKKGISKISFLPVISSNLAQPSIANESEAKIILERLDFSLENRIIYYWDDEYKKDSRAVIYDDNRKVVNFTPKKQSMDLNNNSVEEIYSLENGQLTIMENSKIIWQSLNDWWIDDFVIADSNNDGILDINLSLWKSGDFGSSKPFWVEENDLSIKNHFFIYSFTDEVLKPIWGSSNLNAPNCEFKLADINGNGKNELIVIEGNYEQKLLCQGEYLAIWEWNGWGFSNVWRSEKGNFSNLEIEKIGGKNYIIVDSKITDNL